MSLSGFPEILSQGLLGPSQTRAPGRPTRVRPDRLPTLLCGQIPSAAVTLLVCFVLCLNGLSWRLGRPLPTRVPSPLPLSWPPVKAAPAKDLWSKEKKLQRLAPILGSGPGLHATPRDSHRARPWDGAPSRPQVQLNEKTALTESVGGGGPHDKRATCGFCKIKSGSSVFSSWACGANNS